MHRASSAYGRYQDILRATVAVAFFGTPFQGSHNGFFTAVQLRVAVAQVMCEEVSNNLIGYLSDQDGTRHELDEVIQCFTELTYALRPNLQIVCFYETQETDFAKVLKNLPPAIRTYLGKKTTGIVSLVTTPERQHTDCTSLSHNIQRVCKGRSESRSLLDMGC